MDVPFTEATLILIFVFLYAVAGNYARRGRARDAARSARWARRTAAADRARPAAGDLVEVPQPSRPAASGPCR